MDYNGKIISLIVEQNKITNYLPCYPSAIILDLDIHIDFLMIFHLIYIMIIPIQNIFKRYKFKK